MESLKICFSGTQGWRLGHRVGGWDTGSAAGTQGRELCPYYTLNLETNS